ncbi:hypothetical protein GCM10023238_35420 [Streptomyces heliomycini]
MLGRETALAPVTWTDDGWPRVPTGLPALEVPALERSADEDGVMTRSGADEPDGFDGPVLGPQWSTLRRPAAPDWVSLTARPSHLRLHGGRSPQSLTGPSLVGRRMTSTDGSFEATMEYRPRSFQHLAGITAYYNTRNWYFLHVTAGRRRTDGAARGRLRPRRAERGRSRRSAPRRGPPAASRLRPAGVRPAFPVRHRRRLAPLGPPLDATVLSTSTPRSSRTAGSGPRLHRRVRRPVAWDLTGGGLPADFDEATWRALGDVGEGLPGRPAGRAVRSRQGASAGACRCSGRRWAGVAGRVPTAGARRIATATRTRTAVIAARRP